LDRRRQHIRYVSATEAKQSLGALLDTAQHEPVTIRRQKRDIAVIVSPRDYERLHRLKVRELLDFCEKIGAEAIANGLTEEKLAELLADD
jgi:prevent-host-death family protein